MREHHSRGGGGGGGGGVRLGGGGLGGGAAMRVSHMSVIVHQEGECMKYSLCQQSQQMRTAVRRTLTHTANMDAAAVHADLFLCEAQITNSESRSGFVCTVRRQGRCGQGLRTRAMCATGSKNLWLQTKATKTFAWDFYAKTLTR